MLREGKRGGVPLSLLICERNDLFIILLFFTPFLNVTFKISPRSLYSKVWLDQRGIEVGKIKKTTNLLIVDIPEVIYSSYNNPLECIGTYSKEPNEGTVTLEDVLEDLAGYAFGRHVANKRN